MANAVCHSVCCFHFSLTLSWLEIETYLCVCVCVCVCVCLCVCVCVCVCVCFDALVEGLKVSQGNCGSCLLTRNYLNHHPLVSVKPITVTFSGFPICTHLL